MSETRKVTNKLLEMIEDGLLDKDTLIMACLKYMSEADVADMARINEFLDDWPSSNSHQSNPTQFHQSSARWL